MFDNSLWMWVNSSYHGSLWIVFADAVCLSVGVVVVLLVAALLFVRFRLRWLAGRSALSRQLEDKEVVGFFHPYCAAGGGGERVLWCAIDAVQREHPGVHCVVYTGDVGVDASEILNTAEARFGLKLQRDAVHFAYLTSRRWVEASTWPRFTLLGQSIGSVGLAYEALSLFVPECLIETMGYAFTYPLFRLVMSSKVGAYVHYPTISTDMLERVRTREQGVCNDAVVARSWLLSTLKLVYYRVFAAAYGYAGSFSQVVMTNSSWTRGHIDQLWGTPTGRITTVYPPCDTAALAALPLERGATKQGGHVVLSLAQFRPEKDHPKQLRTFRRFLDMAPRHSSGTDERVRLVVAGGCRDEGDRKRLADLKDLAKTLKLRERGENDVSTEWDVAFCPNVPLPELSTMLGQATVGLHTMRDEHFGISVVEFMAAGAIVLAHDSAGPRMDIVRPIEDGGKKQQTGYLATDEESYATALRDIFALSKRERLSIAEAGRRSVGDRFSQEAFEDAFSSRMISPFRR